jgi:hypothetical protein
MFTLFCWKHKGSHIINLPCVWKMNGQWVKIKLYYIITCKSYLDSFTNYVSYDS